MSIASVVCSHNWLTERTANINFYVLKNCKRIRKGSKKYFHEFHPEKPSKVSYTSLNLYLCVHVCMHCKTKVCTAHKIVPLHTLNSNHKQCVYWDKMVCCKNFRFLQCVCAVSGT